MDDPLRCGVGKLNADDVRLLIVSVGLIVCSMLVAAAAVLAIVWLAG